jgi:hypothetical protein
MSRRLPPLRLCACGRRYRAWDPDRPGRCHSCRRDASGALERARDPETSILAYHRARQGKCVVCGGPYPDGSGCEHCPSVDETRALLELRVGPLAPFEQEHDRDAS